MTNDTFSAERAANAINSSFVTNKKRYFVREKMPKMKDRQLSLRFDHVRVISCIIIIAIIIT